MKEIVTQAANVTAKVCDHTRIALSLLDSWQVNGHGIFERRWEVLVDLDQAIEELTMAKNMLANTEWPSPADYDEG